MRLPPWISRPSTQVVGRAALVVFACHMTTVLLPPLPQTVISAVSLMAGVLWLWVLYQLSRLSRTLAGRRLLLGAFVAVLTIALVTRLAPYFGAARSLLPWLYPFVGIAAGLGPLLLGFGVLSSRLVPSPVGIAALGAGVAIAVGMLPPANPVLTGLIGWAAVSALVLSYLSVFLLGLTLAFPREGPQSGEPNQGIQQNATSE